jgi:signal peptidase I
MRNFLRDILGALILAGVIFFTLQITIQTFVIVGPSMEPGLQSGQRVLINKVAYAFDEPERGDVIVFHPPDNQQTDYIKRIIALPGESVKIKEGIVYIHQNGDVYPLDEPYVEEPPNYDFEGDIIPEDEYFVLGDNRNNSEDSRNDWTVKSEDIIGKAWLRIWPLDEWGVVFNYPLDEQLASAMSE